VIALHPPTIHCLNLARYAWLVAATFYHIFVDTRIPELGQASSVPTSTQALQLVASVGLQLPGHYNTDTVISHFVIWTSLSPLSYYNGSQKPKISEQADAGITRHITVLLLPT